VGEAMNDLEAFDALYEHHKLLWYPAMLAREKLHEQGIELEDISSIRCYVHVRDGGSVTYEDYHSPDDTSNNPLYLWLCCKAALKKNLSPSASLGLGIRIGSLVSYIEYMPNVIKTNQRKKRKAADKGHRNRKETKENIRKEWATGKYKSRNACAEAMHSKYHVALSTVRKYLRNTENPT